MKRKLGILIIILTVVALGVLISTRQIRQMKTNEGAILKTFEKDIPGDWKEGLQPGDRYKIFDIKIEGGWAIANIVLVDGETRQAAGDTGLMIFKKVNGQWKAGFKGTDLYKDWLWEIPETLVPYDLKILIQ